MKLVYENLLGERRLITPNYTGFPFTATAILLTGD